MVRDSRDVRRGANGQRVGDADHEVRTERIPWVFTSTSVFGMSVNLCPSKDIPLLIHHSFFDVSMFLLRVPKGSRVMGPFLVEPRGSDPKSAEISSTLTSVTGLPFKHPPAPVSTGCQGSVDQEITCPRGSDHLPTGLSRSHGPRVSDHPTGPPTTRGTGTVCPGYRVRRSCVGVSPTPHRERSQLRDSYTVPDLRKQETGDFRCTISELGVTLSYLHSKSTPKPSKSTPALTFRGYYPSHGNVLLCGLGGERDVEHSCVVLHKMGAWSFVQEWPMA